MQILMVAAENDAVLGAKVGGVGDVIRDIAPELVNQGHQVNVVLPDYGNKKLIPFKHKVAQFAVHFANEMHPITLWELKGGVYSKSKETLYLFENALFSAHDGNVYCIDDPQGPFAQDATKFALFNAAVCEAITQNLLSMPDVLHLHDWHSACVALLRAYDTRYQVLQDLPCIYSIHNLALQGIRPLQWHESSLAAWFPNLHPDYQKIIDPRYQDCFNPMRSGINLADKVHLVSKTYTEEVVLPSHPEQGFFGGEGLEEDLKKAQQAGKLVGILNGCYYPRQSYKKPSKAAFYELVQTSIARWITKTPYLRSVDYLANERAKQWQQSKKGGILMTSVGRLTDQKMLLLRQEVQGLSALSHILNQLDEQDGRLIILGSGDHNLEEFLAKAMGEHENFLFINGYAQNLSDEMYKYGDVFLMPSSFEPCGISQMLSMRAGQPCIVHQIGGLKDTVIHDETGFSFSGDDLESQVEQMLACTQTAIDCFAKQPTKWNKIKKAAKEQRFEWKTSIALYLSELYLCPHNIGQKKTLKTEAPAESKQAISKQA